ncbi:MAG: hypothetical protein EA397_10400 [Deltaproteobacteria bacterium]|nr:MAG: hypothetical protein EA397_10400 [Deltaproteobacteria bacterium]
MKGPWIGQSPRAGAIVLFAATALAGSYITLRLWQALGGEADPRDVLAQPRIPFSWRIYAALVHAATAGAIGALLPERLAEALLRHAAWFLPLLVFVLVTLAVLVP